MARVSNRVRDRQARQGKSNRAAGVLGENVLVLNSGYMPINTTKVRKAIQLVRAHKAEVVQETDTIVNSATDMFAVPSVIRLKRFVNVPDPTAVWSPGALFMRDHYQCQYCGKQLDPHAPHNSPLRPTVDHIMPKHLFKDKSKASTWTNTCTACTDCNRRKGGMHPKSMKEAGMKFYDPNFEPKRPRGDFLRRTVDDNPAWREWYKLDK